MPDGQTLTEAGQTDILHGTRPSVQRTHPMKRNSTKQAAEAVLGELPSVLGAYVREDVHGNPREVHLLVGPKPDVRLLSHDVRDLLEERLGIPVDQRVISIAQITEDAWGDDVQTQSLGADVHAEETTAEPASAPRKGGRLVYAGLESETRDAQIVVRVRLTHGGREHWGEAEEMDAGAGRIRAAARATLLAITDACDGRMRLDLESASVIDALGREYALITVLAAAPSLGRFPITVAGAHPIESGTETAAILGTLKATNRITGPALTADSV